MRSMIAQTHRTDVGFDPLTHSYFVCEGVLALPGTTALLRAAKKITGEDFFTEEGRDRGTLVHALTHAHDLQGAAQCPQELAGYLAAYRDAVAHLRPSWRELESIYASSRLGYGGTIDRVRDDGAIVDLKTSPLKDWHRLQTALYGLLYRERHGGPLPARFGLYLAKDGGWKLKEFHRTADYVEAHEIARKHGAFEGVDMVL